MPCEAAFPPPACRCGDFHLHRSLGGVFIEPSGGRPPMRALLTSFISGMVFALGLGISGMTRPIKGIGFLDFFGAWDVSLAFVMIGAIAVYVAAFRWSRRVPSPLLGPDFCLPK